MMIVSVCRVGVAMRDSLADLDTLMGWYQHL
uniref:Uncharacterized protein n=1 Tax=Lepeophtheirus salmonis TaxID=72036 RepID=A0A0K2V9F8_LEPSM